MPKGDIVGNIVIDGKGFGKGQQKRTEDEQKEERQNEKSTKAQQIFGEHQHAFKKDGRNVRMN